MGCTSRAIATGQVGPKFDSADLDRSVYTYAPKVLAAGKLGWCTVA